MPGYMTLSTAGVLSDPSKILDTKLADWFAALLDKTTLLKKAMASCAATIHEGDNNADRIAALLEQQLRFYLNEDIPNVDVTVTVANLPQTDRKQIQITIGYGGIDSAGSTHYIAEMFGPYVQKWQRLNNEGFL